MKYLKIQNDGVLDIRLVALMGGTTKANDKYKIGQFGTGLKYTLAFLYRNNLDFKIFAGKDEIKIHLEKEEIKGQVFEIICINGQRTSITTMMGESWEAWMIIRELWSNALDEGGAQKEIVESCYGEEDKTCFCIQIDKQIQKVIDQWHKYFVHSQEPIFKNYECALYPAGDKFCIYKNGILVYEDKNNSSVFSYDLFHIPINELREYNGALSYVMANCLAQCNENAVRFFLENIQDHHYEAQSTTDYSWYRSFGIAWKNVIGSAKIIHKKIISDYAARGNALDTDSMIIVPEVLFKFLSKQFEGIGAVYFASEIGNFFEHFDEQIENKIKQGLVILESCDYKIHPDLTFVYGWFEDKTVLARINLKDKKIMVSTTLLQKPLFCIVSMLIEENEHFNTGMADNTREFQQHFIDLYARQLLATNEVEI